MVYTVTFNPAVDVVVSVDDLKLGSINRTTSQEIYYGGKGVNVSNVLRELGCESVALGFLAGAIGAAMESSLVESGLTCDFVWLPEGETRVNTKLRANAGDFLEETAFNAGGPSVDEASLKELFDKLADAGPGDIVIVSGGVPDGTPKTVYADLLSQLSPSGARVVVDATGELLINALPLQPFLVKPNDEELAEIAGCDPKDYERLLEAARDLRERGALNVLVSQGADGAFLIDEQGRLHETAALRGRLVNSVGAGDSTVAGFVGGYLAGRERGWAMRDVYDYAFSLAVACGSATAFSEGLADRAAIEGLFGQMGFSL